MKTPRNDAVSFSDLSYEEWMADEIDDEGFDRVEAALLQDPLLCENAYRDRNVASHLGLVSTGRSRKVEAAAPRSGVSRVARVALPAFAAAAFGWWAFSGGGPSLPSSSSALDPVSPSGSLQHFPREFRWKPLESAELYEVEIRSASGEPSLVRSSPTSRLRLSDSLVPADSVGAWTWRVRAAGQEGEAGRFEVRR
jgi:hypothetical protein